MVNLYAWFQSELKWIDDYAEKKLKKFTKYTKAAGS